MIHTSRNTTRGKKNDEDREEDEGREKKKKDEREKDRDVEKDRDRENEEQKGEEEDEDDCNFGDAKPDPHFEVYDMRIFLTKYLFFLYFLSRTLYYLHISINLCFFMKLSRPAPPNLLVQCSIKRDKSGFGRFFPKYTLYLSVFLFYFK